MGIGWGWVGFESAMGVRSTTNILEAVSPSQRGERALGMRLGLGVEVGLGTGGGRIVSGL